MRTTIHFDDLLAQYVHLADHNDEDFRRAMLQLNRAKTTDELNQALKGLVKVAHTYPYGYAFLASLYFEGTMVERNDKKAFYYLQKGIKANDPTCIFRFGTELLSESFNKRSIKRAYAFIGKAASMDLPIAMMMFGSLNLGFEDVKPNYPLAFSTFQRLADLNHGEGYAFLGMMHENGMGTPASGVEAVRNYLKSCSLDNPMGHLFFGRFFLSGQFYPRNAEAAAGHLRWSAEHGNLEATHELLNLYLSERNEAWLQDAKTIIDELMQREHPIGTFYYAKASLDGLIYPLQIKKIIRLLKKADFPDTHYLLGQLYSEGIHVKKNVKKALEAFDHGIMQSSFDCLYASLEISLRQVVTKPHYLTMLLNLKAAHLPQANYYLGRLYYEGIGIPIDMEKAYTHFFASQHEKSYRYLGMIEEDYYRGSDIRIMDYYYKGLEQKDWDCYYNLAALYMRSPYLAPMALDFLLKGAEKASLLCILELVHYYQDIDPDISLLYTKQAAQLGDCESIKKMKNHEVDPS
jgi:hypothetical protein